MLRYLLRKRMTGRLNTSERMSECFPNAELLVVPEALVNRAVGDPDLRRLLSSIGIPERFTDVVEFNSDLPTKIESLGEIYARHGQRPPAGSEQLCFVGFAGRAFLGVDGVNGAVFQIHDDTGVRWIASSLERFLATLAFVSLELDRHLERSWRPDYEKFSRRLCQRALAERRRIDPSAGTAEEGAWRELILQILSSEELMG
jgi:hypothetical protein